MTQLRTVDVSVTESFDEMTVELKTSDFDIAVHGGEAVPGIQLNPGHVKFTCRNGAFLGVMKPSPGADPLEHGFNDAERSMILHIARGLDQVAFYISVCRDDVEVSFHLSQHATLQLNAIEDPAHYNEVMESLSDMYDDPGRFVLLAAEHKDNA